MPTLAQALQDRPAPHPAPRLLNVVNASERTVQVSYGNIINATGTVPDGGKVVVVVIAGTDYAIGWVRP